MVPFLRSVFAIYAIIVFWIMLIICVPFYWLGFKIFGRKADRPLLHFGYHIFTPIALFLMGIRIKSRGHKQIQKDQAYVVVSNHQSQLDILVNARSFPGVFKFLSKKELVKLPVYGIIIRRLCILVDRKDPESRASSYETMKAEMADGFSVLLYPEGTRNRTDRPLQEFKLGAFRLASETGAPLAVATLLGAGRLSSPKRTLDLRPGKVMVHWAVIAKTKGVAPEDLAAQSRDLMLRHLQPSHTHPSP